MASTGSKTALLLLDYHNKWVDMIQSEEEKAKFISSVSELVQTARENNTPIVHGLLGVDKEPFPNSRLRERWESTFKPLLASNPEAFAEKPEFAPAVAGRSDSEVTVTRTPGVVSAIKSKNMLHLLKEKWQVERLVIGGISTSGCVLSTAREAADLEFVATVAEEACFDPVPESHRVVLDKVLPMTAHVVGQQKALELLRGEQL